MLPDRVSQEKFSSWSDALTGINPFLQPALKRDSTGVWLGKALLALPLLAIRLPLLLIAVVLLHITSPVIALVSAAASPLSRAACQRGVCCRRSPSRHFAPCCAAAWSPRCLSSRCLH